MPVLLHSETRKYMQDRLYIDDIDAFVAWGVYLQDGSGRQIVQMPPMKAVDTTEWAEYDGLEADLSNPVLDARQIRLDFHLTDITGADIFYDTLTASVYHDFRFPRINKTYRLRLSSCGGISLYIRHGILTLTFSEDMCVVPPAIPSAINIVPSDGYRLDNRDFARYGCRVIEGSEAQVRRWADIRQRVKHNSRYSVGVTYDVNGAIRLKNRDLTINLHLHTSNVGIFWQHWNALFSSLTEAGEHSLSAFGMAFSCYYKSSSTKVFRVTDSGEIWCDFSITLCVLSYGQAEDVQAVRVLAAPDGRLLRDSSNRVIIIG